jgi:hypothetical protein
MCQLMHDYHVFCVPFSTKLNSLLDRLGNRRMMHDYQSDTLKWVRGSRKYIHYYIMRHFTGYNYPFVLRS